MLLVKSTLLPRFLFNSVVILYVCVIFCFTHINLHCNAILSLNTHCFNCGVESGKSVFILDFLSTLLYGNLTLCEIDKDNFFYWISFKHAYLFCVMLSHFYSTFSFVSSLLLVILAKYFVLN